MPFSGILRSVALVRTDVSEERGASIIRVTRMDSVAIHIYISLISTLLADGRSASSSGRLKPGKRAPSAHIIAEMVALTPSLDNMQN
jgi:hypothetical protein